MRAALAHEGRATALALALGCALVAPAPGAQEAEPEFVRVNLLEWIEELGPRYGPVLLGAEARDVASEAGLWLSPELERRARANRGLFEELLATRGLNLWPGEAPIPTRITWSPLEDTRPLFRAGTRVELAELSSGRFSASRQVHCEVQLDVQSPLELAQALGAAVPRPPHPLAFGEPVSGVLVLSGRAAAVASYARVALALDVLAAGREFDAPQPTPARDPGTLTFVARAPSGERASPLSWLAALERSEEFAVALDEPSLAELRGKDGGLLRDLVVPGPEALDVLGTLLEYSSEGTFSQLGFEGSEWLFHRPDPRFYSPSKPLYVVSESQLVAASGHSTFDVAVRVPLEGGLTSRLRLQLLLNRSGLHCLRLGPEWQAFLFLGPPREVLQALELRAAFERRERLAPPHRALEFGEELTVDVTRRAPITRWLAALGEAAGVHFVLHPAALEPLRELAPFELGTRDGPNTWRLVQQLLHEHELALVELRPEPPRLLGIQPISTLEGDSGVFLREDELEAYTQDPALWVRTLVHLRYAKARDQVRRLRRAGPQQKPVHFADSPWSKAVIASGTVADLIAVRDALRTQDEALRRIRGDE